MFNRRFSLACGPQWTLQTPKVAAYLGCVGNDENARTLRKVAEAAGVDVQYLVDDKEPTGLCAVLLNGKNRYRPAAAHERVGGREH